MQILKSIKFVAAQIRNSFEQALVQGARASIASFLQLDAQEAEAIQCAVDDAAHDGIIPVVALAREWSRLGHVITWPSRQGGLHFRAVVIHAAGCPQPIITHELGHIAIGDVPRTVHTFREWARALKVARVRNRSYNTLASLELAINKMVAARHTSDEERALLVHAQMTYSLAAEAELYKWNWQVQRRFLQALRLEGPRGLVRAAVEFGEELRPAVEARVCAELGLAHERYTELRASTAEVVERAQFGTRFVRVSADDLPADARAAYEAALRRRKVAADTCTLDELPDEKRAAIRAIVRGRLDARHRAEMARLDARQQAWGQLRACEPFAAYSTRTIERLEAPVITPTPKAHNPWRIRPAGGMQEMS